MQPLISPLISSILLMTGMLIMLEAGRRIAVARRPTAGEITAHQAQPEVQALFREYLDSTEIYRRLPNMQAAELEMARSKEIQEDILEKGGCCFRAAE